jgi:hypothetical protein
MVPRPPRHVPRRLPPALQPHHSARAAAAQVGWAPRWQLPHSASRSHDMAGTCKRECMAAAAVYGIATGVGQRHELAAGAGLIVCACPRPASSPLHCRQRSPAPRSPTRNAGRNHRPQQRVLVVGEVRRTAAVQAAVAHARAADGARSAARAGATRAFRRAKCGAGAVARSSMRCGTVWHASQPARRRAATEDDQVSPSVVLLIACRFELTHPRLLPQGTEASGHVSFRQQRAGRRRHLGRERRGGGPRAAGNQRGGRHGDGGCRCTCSAG